MSTYKIGNHMVEIPREPIKSLDPFLDNLPAPASHQISGVIYQHPVGDRQTVLVADGSSLTPTIYGADLKGRLPMGDVKTAIEKKLPHGHVIDATLENKKRKMLASGRGEFPIPDRADDELASAVGEIKNEMKQRRATPGMFGVPTEAETSKESEKPTVGTRLKGG